LLALLLSDVDIDNGAVLPFASIRTPTIRNEPDCVLLGTPQAGFDALAQGNVTERVPFAKLMVVMAVTPANSPVAPSMRMGSVGGVAAPHGGPPPALWSVKPFEVIGPGKVKINRVVVRGDTAIN
jgi:hypothetical protein